MAENTNKGIGILIGAGLVTGLIGVALRKGKGYLNMNNATVDTPYIYPDISNSWDDVDNEDYLIPDFGMERQADMGQYAELPVYADGKPERHLRVEHPYEEIFYRFDPNKKKAIVNALVQDGVNNIDAMPVYALLWLITEGYDPFGPHIDYELYDALYKAAEDSLESLLDDVPAMDLGEIFQYVAAMKFVGDLSEGEAFDLLDEIGVECEEGCNPRFVLEEYIGDNSDIITEQRIDIYDLQEYLSPDVYSNILEDELSRIIGDATYDSGYFMSFISPHLSETSMNEIVSEVVQDRNFQFYVRDMLEHDISGMIHIPEGPGGPFGEFSTKEHWKEKLPWADIDALIAQGYFIPDDTSGHYHKAVSNEVDYARMPVYADVEHVDSERRKMIDSINESFSDDDDYEDDEMSVIVLGDNEYDVDYDAVGDEEGNLLEVQMCVCNYDGDITDEAREKTMELLLQDFGMDADGARIVDIEVMQGMWEPNLLVNFEFSPDYMDTVNADAGDGGTINLPDYGGDHEYEFEYYIEDSTDEEGRPKRYISLLIKGDVVDNDYMDEAVRGVVAEDFGISERDVTYLDAMYSDVDGVTEVICEIEPNYMATVNAVLETPFIYEDTSGNLDDIENPDYISQDVHGFEEE